MIVRKTQMRMYSRRCRAVPNDTADGATKLDCCLGTHENMHAGTLGFHELQQVSVDADLPEEEVHTPERVVVVGRDISVGSRPMANSVSALLVAPMFANS